MILSKIASIAFYLLVFTLTFFFAYLRKKTGRKVFGILSILIPAITVASRFNVGTDSTAYTTLFDEVSSEPIEFSLQRLSSFSMEPTAIISIRLLSHFAFGYFAFFLFYSLITFGCLYLFSRKIDKDNFWLFFGSLSMIMLPYCINGMRQAAAISVFAIFLARIFRNPKEVIKNLALLICAFLFHFSALLLIPAAIVILLYRRFGFKSSAILTISITVFALAVFPKAISVFLETGLMPYKYAETLEVYEGTLLNFDFVIFSCLAILLIVTRKRSLPSQIELEDFTTLAIICNLLYAGLGFYSAYIGRMSDYFWPFATLGIWLCINRFNDSPRFKTALYITAISSYFVLAYFVMGNSEILPFRFLS